MKLLLSVVAALATTAALAAPAQAAGHICLSTRNIESSSPRDDGAAINFKMRDGSVWRNDLLGRCPDLRFNGFVWTVRNPGGTVCENEETIRVLRSGEICTLGKFTQTAPARGQKSLKPM
jgi:hypothetical protein